MKTIGFIGCGNMGRAMVEGIMKANLVDGDHMIVSNAHPERLSELSEIYDCYISDNESVAKNSDIVVLAIKPYLYKEVITSIKDIVKDDVIIINIAAGISTQDVVEMFGRKVKTVKAMPNTPAMVFEGAFALCSDNDFNADELEAAKAIYESIGIVELVPEHLIDAVCGLSGGGPAYAAMFIEAMADGGVKQGLPRATAYRLAAQTCLGTAKMILEKGIHPGELKDMVTSPGGTTIEGCEALEKGGMRAAVIECINAGAEKSRKL